MPVVLVEQSITQSKTMADQPRVSVSLITKALMKDELSGVISIASSGSIRSIRTESDSGRRHSILERSPRIDHFRGRYPHCLVWTPITVITWFMPIFGHVGIAYTNGKIRDFSDAFVVGEDRMAYGRPVKYLVMDTSLAVDYDMGWDEAITTASEEYTDRDHNTFCDNSFSMVALALNLMSYKNSRSWNMFWVFLYMLGRSKYVDCCSFFKAWGPFLLLVVVASILALPFLFDNPRKNAMDRSNGSLVNISRAEGHLVGYELQFRRPRRD